MSVGATIRELAKLGLYPPSSLATAYSANSNALLKFRAARGLTTRRTRVAVVGDSVARGVSTGAGTTQAVNAWPMQLARLLQASGINAGANNVWGDGGSWNLGQTIGNFLTGDSRVTTTGAWALGSTKVPGGNNFAATAAGSMTFTPTSNTTKADIYWRDGATGRNFSWAVDGGSATQVNSTGTTQIVKTTVSLGTSGIHALTIAWVAGSINIVGIDAYDDTGGRTEISIQNWGISGATSPAFLDNSDTAVGRLAAFSFYQPDLTIICPFINNWRTSLSTAQTLSDLIAIVTKAQLTGSAAILTPPYDGSTSGLSAQQDSYAVLAYSVAAAYGAAVIDHRSTLTSYTAANAAGLYSDTVHQTASGYADIARYVKQIAF